MKKRYLSAPFYVLYFSIFLVLFYALPALSLKYHTNIAGGFSAYQTSIHIIGELLLAIVITTTALYLFSFSSILLKIMVVFFITASTIFSYYVWQNHIGIDEFFIATLFEVPLHDAGEAISWGVFIYFFILGLIPIYFWVFVVKIRYHGRHFFTKVFKYLISLVLTAAILGSLLLTSYLLNKDMGWFERNHYKMRSALSVYMPLNYVAGLYQYLFQLRPSTQYNSVNIAEKYPFSFYDDKFKNDNYTVILVLGESSRAANQQLNGYARQTNPNLVGEENLINFSDMTSCNTYTVYSVNCMLSRKVRVDFQLNTEESNLISAFKALGFKTYYFSTQPLYNETSLSYFLAKDADVKVFANQVRLSVPSNSNIYDEYLLDFVKDIPQDNQKKLIILHLMTSHTPYNLRYPKQFEVFKPNTVVDEYDNSLVYTDYVLHKLLNIYRDEKAFVFFASDHGESLGENGIYLHASAFDTAPREQTHVFSFVWASQAMKNMMGDKFNNIKTKKDLPLSHDNLFPSMFDCMGIESSIVDKSLSLCYSPISE
ncbi:MAG: phosphoethanolamine transferase [Alphaproteobacteria bacterium]|jgi:lipid A ethanolaminephosphotransferase|nr:phosphoethanolamine transferase [Alphaproteobacteria bacterium]